MHIGVLFYSETFFLSKEIRNINGRTIANLSWVTSLLENKEENHQVSLIVSSEIEKEALLEEWPLLKTADHIVPILQLSRFLEKYPLDVLHTLGPDLYRPLYIRQKFKGNFSVTGMTHSLAHSAFLDWLILTLHHQPQISDHIICTSPTAEQVIQNLLNQAQPQTLSTTVIPLGVDFKKYQQKIPNLREKLGISSDALILLTVARFSYYTKTDLIPELLFFRSLKKTFNNPLKLILAGATGEENYESLLKTVAQELGISDSVIIITNPTDEAKRALYQTANLFIAPNDSLQETFGLSILEAMASGLPVIASDWNGYRSIVTEGEDGFLIPTTTIKSSVEIDPIAPLLLDSLNHLFYSQAVATDLSHWKEKTLLLLKNEDLRKKMGINALKKAESFAWPLILKRYFKLWETLVPCNTPLKLKQPELPIVMKNHEDFLSYPTQLLSKSDLFKLSETGHELVSGKIPLRLYEAMSEVLSSQTLQAILSEALKSSINCEKLESKKIFQVEYHLLWLYKYHFLERSFY